MDTHCTGITSHTRLLLLSAPVPLLIFLIQIVFPSSVSASPRQTIASGPATPVISQQSITIEAPSVQAAYSGCAGPNAEATHPALEQQVVELTNAERANAGLPPLKLNDELSIAMRDHAVDMTEDDYFAHDSHDRNGDSLVHVCAWHERVRGYVPDARAMAENIAWGYGSPEDVVDAWMESDGHRANLLSSSYSELGVSYHSSRWGQDFAQRLDVYPVVIDSEAASTESTSVRIYVYGDWDQIRLRNDGGEWSNWQTFEHWTDWDIPAVAGVRQVDVELRNDETSIVSSDTIEYTGSTVVEPPPGTVRPAMENRVFLPFAVR